MLSRREFLVGNAVITAAAAHSTGAQQPSSEGKPNIIFILADDLGWGDLSCYGRPDYKTPVLDDLAARGIRFAEAYANSSTCSPTRVALMTGRYQNRLPVGLYDPLPAGTGVGLPPYHPTLPSLLRTAGYRTALVGKWHLGWPPGFGPLKSGYDEFFGQLGGAMTYFTHKTGGFLGPPGAPGLYEGDTVSSARATRPISSPTGRSMSSGARTRGRSSSACTSTPHIGHGRGLRIERRP